MISSVRRAACAVAMCLASSLFVSPVGAADQALDETRAAIKTAIASSFPGIQIEAIEPVSWADGWFEIVTAGQIAYTNKDGSLLFSGKVLDTKNKEDLTTKRWNEIHKIDFDALPFEKAIKTVRGDGSRKLAVFADPDCPFCAELERVLVLVNDVTIYTFLFPLENLHPDAAKKAKNIWCSNDRLSAWNAWMLKDVSPPAAECDISALSSVKELGVKLKINSTPTMFFADGQRFAGSMSLEQLSSQLERARERSARK